MNKKSNTLPVGYRLHHYRIEAVLGAGGFGITYKAVHEALQTRAAIKEYFPVEWSFRDTNGVTVHPNTQGQASNTDDQASDYVWGLERFLDEARVLARVQHPFVVRIKRYFRAHGTAYIVMDYEEGEPLSAILQDGETLGEDEVRGLLEDVLPALQAVHDQGFLHRDIKPSNLYVRSSDHRVILIDFGAAREAIGRHSKSVTSLVTPGYSPPEQYTTRNDRYGTWTDIYALGAVLYRCITGHTPAEAAERLMDDTLEPATQVGAGRYSTNLLHAVDRALAVRPEHRFRTVAEMQAALVGSADESSDETVIMLPLHKPGKMVTSPVPLPRLTERPDRVAAERTGSGQEVTQRPVNDPQTARSRHSVLQSPPGKKTSRRRLLGVLASSGVLAVLVVASTFWLWPVTPEAPPLPAVDPTTASPPAVITPEPPPVAVTPVSPPVAATPEPPPVAVTPASPPVATMPEPQAEMTPPAAPTVLILPPAPDALPPAPASDATTVQPDGPVPAIPLAPVENTPVIPVPISTPAPTPRTQAESTADLSEKTVVDKQPVVEKSPRRIRSRADRRRKAQSAPEPSAPPVRAQPAPASPTRPSYWDKPTDSGFNNK